MANEVFKSDANLQGLWLMEESSGMRYDSAPGGENDLTDNNTVGSSTTHQEGARSADFERSNSESLSITDAAQVGLAITGNFSVVLWFRPESIDLQMTLVGKWAGTGNQKGYHLWIDTDESVNLSLSGNGVDHTTGYTTGSKVAVGTWVHLAGVYNGTDIRIYVNGALSNNGSYNPRAYVSGIFDSTASFRVGSKDDPTSYTDGMMDEVAVFNRALSAAEIASIYNYGLQEAVSLAGALSSAGAITRQAGKALAGGLTSSGAVESRLIYTQAVAGALSSAGALARQVSYALAGALSSAGALARKVKLLTARAGTLTTAGNVTKKARLLTARAGTLTTAGALARKGKKALAGGLTSAGAVTSQTVESLLSYQKKLTVPEPVVTLTIGSHDLSDYVVGYRYEEEGQADGSLAIWLDNRDDHFDDLVTDWPDLKRGAAVDLRRGYTISTTDRTEKLPRTWIDSLQYVYDDGAGMLLLSCVDWWGRLATRRYGSKQTWSSTAIRTIAEAILTQAGLTLQSGAFGYNVTHEVDVNEDLDEALRDLMDKVDEFLYAGLDGEILFKTLDLSESAGYTYGWTDEVGVHPLMDGTEIAESSAEYNRVTVNGSGAYTGTAEDTDEIALVGTRQRTITDESLTSNAQCLERAQGELSFWQARATAGTLVARPHMSLRLYDVVSVAAPVWGGPALAKARVTGIVESYGFGDWEQEITVGEIPEHSLLHVVLRPGKKKSSARRKQRKTTSRAKKATISRYSYAKRQHTHKEDEIEDLDHYSLADLLLEDGMGSGLDADLLDGAHLAAIVPSGVILMWSGSVVTIPSGWALCDGSNGTPNLSGCFIVAAGGGYSPGDTGGAATVDLSHTHGPGTLNTASDSHSHTAGTYATDTASTHTHGPGSLTIGANDQASLRDRTDGDVNGPPNGHIHSLTGGSTASGGSHDHDVTGSSASDSHDHDVDSGVTASGGTAAQSILPPYYALCFIMKL